MNSLEDNDKAAHEAMKLIAAGIMGRAIEDATQEMAALGTGSVVIKHDGTAQHIPIADTLRETET